MALGARGAEQKIQGVSFVSSYSDWRFSIEDLFCVRRKISSSSNSSNIIKNKSSSSSRTATTATKQVATVAKAAAKV